MKISLQRRLILSFVPILILIGVLGMAGRILFDRLGNASNAILRENYDSVVAMVGLNEALERIDSDFRIRIQGQAGANDIYLKQWRDYDAFLEKEKRNITLPGEKELVEELDQLTKLYRKEGDAFFELKTSTERKTAYNGREDRSGLYGRFLQIKKVSGDIREMNQRNMEEASRSARATAESSRGWFTLGLILAASLTALLAWRSARSVARPLEELKKAAAAIGRGDLNQTVSILAHDELGELAGTFNLMAGQLRDFRQSHLARLLRAQQTSQATIDSFPDPVLVIDLEGRVEMANPAARRLLGVAPGEPTGAAPWIPPGPLQVPLRQAISHQEAHLSLSFDQAVAFRLDNEDRSFLPHILPIRDPHGSMLGAAVVLNDITRFRLMDQFKSDLVATVSHEMKTPLTSFRLAVHILLEEAVGPLNSKQAELLIDARENAERLLDLIEHLLSLARLENTQDTLKLEAVEPMALLRRAADAARARADDKHVEMVIHGHESLPPVAADHARISIALGNLLENAVTYTPAGGTIALSVEKVGEDAIVFSVADTGVGIPVEFLPHVFDKFFRIPEQSEGAGTGLGLAIVKEIAAAHHGRITCESQPGKGTVFHLTLPVWNAPAV